MSIKLQLPKLTDLKPRIIVIGVGGAGGNAINNMIASGLNGVEYIAANTDAQALSGSSAEQRIQLGVNLTEGLGAGSKPEIGEAAAEEAIEDIRSQISGAHMVFIAGGMGGGTGTGAAAVIARVARELEILTVGIVTKPFQFEGVRRMRTADAGIAELKKHVDTLIVIPNQNLFRVANEKTTFADAFVLADQVLYSGIACIVDLIIKEGLINLDFADVKTVMSGMGSAMMGTGDASGERRAIRAAEEAIANPLLDEVSLKGAKGLLLSIIGGRDMTLYEVDEAATRVRQEVDADANIIVGATFDENMGDRVRVAIVASGMAPAQPAVQTMSRSAPRQQTPPPPLPVEPPHANRAPATGPSPSFDDLRRAGEPAGQPMPHRGPMPSPMGAPMQRNSREVWRAPGNVIIEEGHPLPPPMGIARTTPPPLDAKRSAETFEPQAPQDIRRSPRQMPEVSDFPMVGQMDYMAKNGQYNQSYDAPSFPRAYDQPPADSQPPERQGFLRRMIGRRGNDSSEHHQRAENRPGSIADPRTNLPPFFNRNKG